MIEKADIKKMLRRLLSVRLRFGSDRTGFCLGSALFLILMLLVYYWGIQASLRIGPGGDFPSITDVFLYALSHDDLSSLLVSVTLLLLFGPHQEQHWGTVALLALSILTMIILPLVYTLGIFVCGDGQHFIGMLQELGEFKCLDFIPDWLYVPTLARFRLPTYTTSHSSLPQFTPVDQPNVPPVSIAFNQHSWMEPLPAWIVEESTALSKAEVLEEQMLRAGILASLEDAPEEDPDAKVEVPKSSVSSLRLQQLEKMGFPTEKAVVALAASKQLDGAISLLIEDSIGEKAVVVSKGKNPPPLQRT
ncbi:rhomboid domain-containing protein 3 isoform X2 [Melanotaenia boesemani]|uniref:rhomboid domain-containing protein 3 isoform X2 n=1 Tax=Melanotaenia boesemani TaxID=1250792 RepID=UPI001C05D8F0|nr:rhomboid domain-containing protein 3 isoform X2 [Melanotaenia boesemani]